jgi:hypothetical protein
MTDDDLHRHCWTLVRGLDPEKVRHAAAQLGDAMPPEDAETLSERIRARPGAWLEGDFRHEYGHHGWGTGVRNWLRQRGLGEAYFGIDNLDDYYVPLVELALGFADPYAPTPA